MSMLDQILGNPDFADKVERFEPGQAVFLEGDASGDVFMLVSGVLDVLKGRKKIAELNESGSVFGEMSLLLEGARTASVKCLEEATILRISGDEIDAFIEAFPQFSQRIAKVLAQRLNDANRTIYGFREFADRLPDALLLTDKTGRALSWNKAAEGLYGREWGEMEGAPAEELFCNHDEYECVIKELEEKPAIQDWTMELKTPSSGCRYVSMSASTLVDGHGNFQGYVFIGRDVTSHRHLANQYSLGRKLVWPVVGLFLLLLAAMILSYPYFSKGREVLDERMATFQDQVGRDLRNLSGLLAGPAKERAWRWDETHNIIHDYFQKKEAHYADYAGVILLNKAKRVVDAYFLKEGKAQPVEFMTNYSDLDFLKAKDSPHFLVTFYQVDEDNPMGQRNVNVVFMVESGKEQVGWLMLMLDMEAVQRDYGLNEDDLLELRLDGR